MGVVLDHLDQFRHGIVITVELTLLSYALAFLIGLVVAGFRVSPVGPLRAAGTAYVETVRNVPLAVHFVLFFFALPKIGIIFSPFRSAVIVLAYYHGSFATETIRAGINTVSVGQAEAARSLGFTFPGTLIRVVLPQAVRSVVAPLGSLFIALTKNTSVAFLISVTELTGTADKLATDTARPIPAFLGAAAGYLLLTLFASLVLGALERRVAVKR
ncbi:MAG TPA: amino acid ABC transporter permease [Acidimicrobiales bacterium]